jgi:hypothetical protein
VSEIRESFWRRHRWATWVACGLLLLLAVAAGMVEFGLRRAEPFLRAQIIASLENRFHARVELDSFHISLADGLWAEGNGLRIWPPAEVAAVAIPVGAGKPLINLDEFRFHAPLRYRPGKPIRVERVELKGLSIHLPPRSHFEHLAAGRPGEAALLVRFAVETLECTGAELVMETDKPGKLPLEFAIARLNLTNIASGGAIKFDAELTNPRPRGKITTTGSIGPWQGADFGDAPMQGEYRMEQAELASFKGIAGALSSTGRFAGTLRDLTVDGETETPDFRLTHFGNAMRLTTRFHARVDGTNGDTWLEPVEATLGHSHFSVKGSIVRLRGAVVDGAQQYGGHEIALTVNVDRGRIEDFLHLASRTPTPLLTGDVTVKTSLQIPPGQAPVHERLKLAGWFALENARFSSEKIQGRILELSLRGQGRTDELKSADPASILSQMQGSFQMAGGVVTLPALTYTVPGAAIQLKGTYGIEGGALHFDGSAKMDASVSKMVGGWKGLLLTPADRFFKKEGAGTELPIHIEGTRDEPKFTIDFGHMKASFPPRPAEKQ